MKILFSFLIFFIFVQIISVYSLEVLTSNYTIRESKLSGSITFTYAQWDLEFDEDLYYTEGSRCVSGSCRDEFRPAAVVENPCLRGCDYTDVDRCGIPVAGCQCEDKDVWCDANEWEVLEINQTYHAEQLRDTDEHYYRFYWDRICTGFEIQIESYTGGSQAFASPFTPFPTASDNCAQTSVPDSFGVMCPGSECFSYGTWSIRVVGYFDYNNYTIRIAPISTGNGENQVITEQPAELAVYNIPCEDTPINGGQATLTCLTLGLPVQDTFGLFEFFKFYYLISPYCGLVFPQVELNQFDRNLFNIEALVTLYSTETVPFSFGGDQTFITGSTKSVYICPAAPSPVSILYITIGRVFSFTQATVDFTLNLEIFRDDFPPTKHKIGELIDPENQHYAPSTLIWNRWIPAGSISVDCPASESYTYSANCLPGQSVFQDICRDLWYPYPTPFGGDAFFGQPPAFNVIDSSIWGSQLFPPTETASNRFSVAMLLEAKIGSQIALSPIDDDLGQNFTDFKPWQEVVGTCKLSLTARSSLTDENGHWPAHQVLTPEITEPLCDYDQLIKDIDDINKFTNQLIDFEGRSLASSIRYAVDAVTFRPAWQGCSLLAKSLLTESETDVDLIQTTKCFDDTPADDPCCSSTESWTSCCTPRDLSTTLISYDDGNKDDLEQACSEADCANNILNRYSSTIFSEEIGTCDTPSIVEISDLQTFSGYRHCFGLAFGDDQNGIFCSSDSDCDFSSFGFSVSRTCDVQNNRCIQDLEEAETEFFRCLGNVIPNNVRIAIIERLELDVGEGENAFFRLLQDYFSQEEFCVSSSYPTSPSHRHLIIDTSYPGCAKFTDWFGLDWSKVVPPWTEGNQRQSSGASCAYFHDQEPELSASACELNNAFCNWDSSITDTAQCLSPPNLDSSFCSFCGDPNDPSTCQTLDDITSIEECQETNVCVLANGETILGLSRSECENRFSCSSSTCYEQIGDTNTYISKPCETQEECENTSGYCSDEEYIYSSIENSYWTFGQNIEGFCVFPMLPFNAPDCSTLPGSGFDFPSSYGCVRYSTCAGAGALGQVCQFSHYNQTLCESAGGTWRNKFIPTKATCESVTRCNAPNFGIPSITSVGAALKQPKDDVSCTTCGGAIVPVDNWIGGKWLNGVVRRPIWKARAFESPYTKAKSVDFFGLHRELQDASVTSVASQLLNNLQCTYSTIKSQLRIVACDCGGDGDIDCYEKEDNFIGIGRICPLQENSIIAPPATINVFAADINSNVVNECVEVEIHLILASDYDPIPLPSVTTGFVEYDTAPDTGTYESVRNVDNAVVGQVIGDGIELVFDEDDVGKVLSIYVCLSQNEEIDQKVNRYEVLDFGRTKDDRIVRPRDIDNVVESATGQICGVIRVHSDERKLTILPIRRIENFDDKDGDGLDGGDKALLYTVATLFVVVFVIVIVQTGRLISLGIFSLRQATNFLWILLVPLLLIRAIYFYLVAEEVLGLPDEHELVDFFMIDFPMVIYMLCNLVVALSFVFLRIRQTNAEARKPIYFWGIFSILAFLFIMTFVGALLAFRYRVLDDDDDGTDLCPHVTDNSDTARTIRIVFETIIVSCAVIIAIVEAISGVAIWRQISDAYGAERILHLSIIASLGLMSDSIAFLIYYIVDEPHPYFAIVLIFTEIIPITFMVYTLSTQQIKGATSAGSGGSTTDGGSTTHQYY